MMKDYVYLIQRELWEHRSLIVVPAVIGGLTLGGVLLFLVGGVVRGIGFDNMVRGMSAGGETITTHGITALLMLPQTLMYVVLAGLVFFYSIDSLYAERKDRSILFWRSLPVTDTETVVSKLFIAAIVAPLIAFVVIVVTQIATMVLATLAVWMGGGSAVELVWKPAPLVRIWIFTLWGYLSASLWFLPFIAWFLLCSVYAKKNVFLLSLLPFPALWLLEKIVFGTGHFFSLVIGRFVDFPENSLEFDGENINIDFGADELEVGQQFDILALIDVGSFFTSPALYGGLIVAAGLCAGTIYLRRYRADSTD